MRRGVEKDGDSAYAGLGSPGDVPDARAGVAHDSPSTPSPRQEETNIPPNYDTQHVSATSSGTSDSMIASLSALHCSMASLNLKLACSCFWSASFTSA